MIRTNPTCLARACSKICSTHIQSICRRQRSITTDTTMATSTGHDYEDPELQTFLRDVHDLMVNDALVKGTNRDNKVTNFIQPHELQEKLSLHIENDPVKHSKLLDLCKTVIHYSLKTSHTGFHNQLYSGVNGYGLAGAWLTDTLNTNLHTFEVAPVFIILEKYLVQKLCGIVGYMDGDGVFCPGGSFTNIMAANLARYRAKPDFKEVGMYGEARMKMYTSAEAHYSLQKGAVFLGMGSNNVVGIETDERGRMKPQALEEMIIKDKENGEVPMFVMATAGTTVLGAYDQLDALADVCRRHSVWFHVDACWGGGVMLSGKHKHLMEGCQRSDSLSWNLHKMTAAPLQCSALLTKQKDILDKCNGTHAEYLFQKDKNYDTSFDIGDKTIQCGRKVDVLKLWFMWKAIGDSGMAATVDKAFDNASYFTKKIAETGGFRLAIPEFQCTNVCFWYIPPSLRGQTETDEWWQKVSKVAPIIKKRMMEKGTLMIGYTPLSAKGFVNLFRIIIENRRCEHSDMDFVIEEIDRLGNDL